MGCDTLFTSYTYLKQRYCTSSFQITLQFLAIFGEESRAIFEFTMWHDFFIKLRRNTAIGKQFLISNDGCTYLVEILSKNSLKGDLLNATTFNPPLFSLVNTFKELKLSAKLN